MDDQQPAFEALPLAIAQAWVVQVTWADGKKEQVKGFVWRRTDHEYPQRPIASLRRWLKPENRCVVPLLNLMRSGPDGSKHPPPLEPLPLRQHSFADVAFPTVVGDFVNAGGLGLYPSKHHLFPALVTQQVFKRSHGIRWRNSLVHAANTSRCHLITN